MMQQPGTQPMLLDRTYRPRRRRRWWGDYWPLYLLAVASIILYEQRPAWLSPSNPTPTPLPTRAAIAFIADAGLALAAGDYDVALTAYAQASRLEPENAGILAIQSEIQLYFGDTEKALSLGQRAVEAEPRNPQALTALARAYNWDNDNVKALQYAFEALEYEPESPTATAVLAEIYTDEGNLELAENYLQQALARDPADPLVLRNQAYLYERRREYDNAIAALQAALQVAPHRFDLYIEMARIYRVGLADYTKANEALAQAVRVYESPMTLDAQGEGLNLTGDYLQAVVVLRKALELDPDYGPALVHLGQALYARRNYEDASEALERGLRIIGERARIEQLYTAGLAYVNKEPRECDKAIPWLLKALEIDGNASPARQGLVTCGQQPPDPVDEPG
jgi:tetratricopeptide (TPR) repeat protein